MTTRQPTTTGTDDLTTTLQALPRRVWLLPLAALVLFGTWASISVPVLNYQEAVAGIDTDAGLPMLLLIGIIVVAELLPFSSKRLKQTWLLAGILYTALALLSVWHIRSTFRDAQAGMSGNPFAAGVSMEIGLALYLAALIGVGIAAIGYRMDRTTVATRDRL